MAAGLAAAICRHSCLPRLASPALSPVLSSATSTPILPSPSATLLCTYSETVPLRHAQRRRAAHAHVLADGRHHLLDVVGNRQRLAGERQRQQLVEVAAGLRRQRGDLAHHVLELLVAGDEVGLRVDLDDRPRVVLGGDADQALGGDAAGLVGGLRQSLLAQPVDRALDVALGLGERRLAVHHAGAGLVAQLLDEASGDIGHCLSLPAFAVQVRWSVVSGEWLACEIAIHH